MKIKKSDIGIRVLKGSFWALIGAFFSRGMMILASIIVARLLGKTEYGELGIVRSTITMFSVFAGFGLGLTATKYVAELQEKNKERTGKIIGITILFAGFFGVIISGLIFFLAPILAKDTLNAFHLTGEIRLGAIILFFSALNGAQTGVLAGFESFKEIAKINFIAGVLAFPIQVLLTYLFGLSGAVLGFGLNFILLWFLNFSKVRQIAKSRNIKIDFFNCLSEWNVLYKFSLPAVFSGLLVSPVVWACNAILVNQTNGYDQMAIFDIANQWRNAVLFIPIAISQIALPLFASSSNDKGTFTALLKYNLIINFIISSVIALIIILIAPFIVGFYGEEFLESIYSLRILVCSTVFMSVNNVIGQAIAGQGKMWVGFGLNFIWGVLLVVFTLIMINRDYGAIGLSIAYLISYLFHTVNSYVVYKKILC